MRKPLVSVLVPVYNAEKYLSRCIESIIMQTYTEIEIILVDDGSIDNCSAICDEYAKKDARIKVIHKKNQGVSVARNTALDLCVGEYICFVDADDYIDLNMIKEVLEYISSKEADIVCFNYYKDYGSYIEHSSEYKDEFTDLEVLLPFFEGRTSRAVWNKFYKRKVWLNLRFQENMTFAEDWFVLSNAYVKAEKIVAIEKAYYFYNLENDNSICHTINQRGEYFDFLCVKEQVDLIKNKLNKLLKYKQLLFDKVMKKALVTCLKAYHHNLYFEEIGQNEKNELILFIKQNVHHSRLLNLKDKLQVYSLLYVPIINRVKGYIYYWKNK